MKVFCILSDHRAFRSKSPAMHQAVLNMRGLDGVYVPFCVAPEMVKEAVLGLKALGVAGANVTVPYKEKVMDHLDGLSDEAAAVGAVNTIVPRENGLYGHNTDVGGFMDALEGEGFDPAGKTALVFGAGGASKAVLYALKQMGASRIILAGRDPERLRATAEKFGVEPVSQASLIDSGIGAELIINATSVSSPEESPELAELISGLKTPAAEFVLDLNYGRDDNFWRLLAEKQKIPFLDGLMMLAHQARRSFVLWTGLQAEAREFWEALKACK